MPRKKKREEEHIISGVAIDESNHGRDHEIFVAVSSVFEQDTNFYTQPRNPLRIGKGNDPRKLTAPLAKRNWRYMLVDRQHYTGYQDNPGGLITVVSAELVDALNLPGKQINVFIDGEGGLDKRQELKRKLKKRVSDDYYLPLRLVNVTFVPKHRDLNGEYKTNYLLTLADALSNYLFRRKTLEELHEGRISWRRIEAPAA